MSYNERELLPLSGLQHLVFCERQAALIHLEQQWDDNALTVEGSHRHRRVHDSAPRRERRGDKIIVRGLLLQSLELGLAGVADVVEFYRVSHPPGIPLSGIRGTWMPFPVEYKRGRPKSHRADEVQLCAQAMCLEEMLQVELCEGALFYGKEQRRIDVLFDDVLRSKTTRAAQRFQEIITTGITPPAIKEKKCSACSLVDLCLPEATKRYRSARRYISATLHDILEQTENQR